MCLIVFQYSLETCEKKSQILNQKMLSLPKLMATTVRPFGDVFRADWMVVRMLSYCCGVGRDSATLGLLWFLLKKATLH